MAPDVVTSGSTKGEKTQGDGGCGVFYAPFQEKGPKGQREEKETLKAVSGGFLLPS